MLGAGSIEVCDEFHEVVRECENSNECEYGSGRCHINPPQESSCYTCLEQRD